MNHSTHMIIVTSIRLMECENVQGNCGTRRMKQRVRPGARVMVQRVRARSPDQPFGLRYSFTWKLKVGETLDLTQVLVIKALNSAAQELPRIYPFTGIALGQDFVELDGSKLTGKAAGTAALLVWASAVRGPTRPSKGASRILIQVTP